MNIGKPSKDKLYMDGKEIGEAENTITAPHLKENKPTGIFSSAWGMSEEDWVKFRWEIDRSRRIRKYIKQIFRL